MRRISYEEWEEKCEYGKWPLLIAHVLLFWIGTRWTVREADRIFNEFEDYDAYVEAVETRLGRITIVSFMLMSISEEFFMGTIAKSDKPILGL